MLRRLIIGLSTFVIGALLMSVLAIALLLNTDRGRHMLLDFAVPRIEKESGIGIAYGALGGSWPGVIEINDLVLSDAEGVWFRARRIGLAWRPEGVLSGTVDIAALRVVDGDLLREPVAPPDEEGDEESKPGKTTVRLSVLQLERFHLAEPIVGQDLRFDLAGALTVRPGGHFSGELNFDADTPDDFSSKLHALLGSGLKLNTLIDGDIHGAIDLKSMSMITRDGRIALAGTASYVRPAKAVAAEFKGELAKEVTRWLSEDLTSEAPIPATVRLSGMFRELRVESTLNFAAANWRGAELPPTVASADLLIAHRHIEGPIALSIEDPTGGTPGSLAAHLIYDRKSRLQIIDFTASYRGATAMGALDFELDPWRGTADISLAVPELSALPLPIVMEGALDAEGRIAVTDGTAAIDASATSKRMLVHGVDIKTASLTAAGPLDALDIEATAESVTHEGVGTLSSLSFAARSSKTGDQTLVRVARLTGTLDARPLALAREATITITPDRTAEANFTLKLGDGVLEASGEIVGPQLAANLRAIKFEPPRVPALVDGTVSIDTRKPQAGVLDLEIVPTRQDPVHVMVDVKGSWDSRRLALTAGVQGYGEDAGLQRIEPLKLSLPLLLEREGKFAVSTEGPIEGRILYDGSVAPFVALAPLVEQTLTGRLSTDIEISGTIGTPQFDGRASLRDATYEHVEAGVLLDHLTLDGRIEKKGAEYQLTLDLQASDGRSPASGTPIRGDGRIMLGKAPSMEARINVDHARIVNREDLDMIASGALTLGGALPDLSASGAVTIHSVNGAIPESLPPHIVPIEVVAVDASGRRIERAEGAAPRTAPLNIALDVTIGAPEQVFIRGRGLESEWSANLHVTGTSADPRLEGTLDVRRGRFDFSGRRFDLTRGQIRFVPSRTSDPDLDIEARNEAASGVVAIISIRGRASLPVIELTSEPPLPQEDIMALILFGKPARELTAFEAVRVADAITRLTGTSPFSGPSILDRARSSLGLDTLDISIGGEGAGLTIGKYVREGVFVSATPGLAGKPGSIAVEIEVNDSISVETDVGQDSQGSVGINWKHDY